MEDDGPETKEHSGIEKKKGEGRKRERKKVRLRTMRNKTKRRIEDR